MFGPRQDSRRVLIPVTENDGGDILGNEDDLNMGSPGTSYFVLLRERIQRRKLFLIFASSGVLLVLAGLIMAICLTGRSHAVIPTPSPVISTTTLAPTTTSTTTEKPTTTTSATTTSKSTTTTPTTTTSTTTTEKPTTTTPTTTTSTTTTEKPTTTTPTTTTSTSTTEKPTTTTSASTTSKPTTTTEQTTTKSPGPVLPTTQPIPKTIPKDLHAKSLLLQVGLKLNYTDIECQDLHPPAFRVELMIDQVNGSWVAESDKKKNAEEAAAMLAVHDLIGITYNKTEPPPPNPCFKNDTAGMDFHEAGHKLLKKATEETNLIWSRLQKFWKNVIGK